MTETKTPCPTLEIRDATDADMETVQAIYAHHVENSVSSFEEVAPNIDAMHTRRADIIDAGLPYVVAMCDGAVKGFAYAGPFRPRSAYRYTVENSIYVAPDATGLGLGRMLLSALIDRCTDLGYRQMIAVIGGGESNAGSVALHSKLGFEKVALLPSVGHKFGRWVDTLMMQRALGNGDKDLPGG